MRAYERLLNYVRVYTTSVEDQEQIPSTDREFDLANRLVEELKELGVEDARVDAHCYVYGTIPATPGCENAPAIGFIAHMDTAPDFCGENVKPQIIENYDGGEVQLGHSGRVLSPKQFPHHIIAQLTADTGYKYFHSLSLFLLNNYKAAKSRQEPNLTPTIIHHYLYFVNC